MLTETLQEALNDKLSVSATVEKIKELFNGMKTSRAETIARDGFR